MTDIRKGPGAPNGDATRTKGNCAKFQYGPGYPRHQAPPLADDPEGERSAPIRAKSRRAKSDYPPGSAYMPDEESQLALQDQLLELLRKRGPEGVTKLDAPERLSWSLAQHVFGLRRKGCEIKTVPEQLGFSRIGRYVLISTAGELSGKDRNGEAGP